MAKHVWRTLCAVGVGAAVASPSLGSGVGQTYLFDLGGDFNVASTSTTMGGGNAWNTPTNFAFNGVGSIVDTSGAVSNLTFGFTGLSGEGSFNGPAAGPGGSAASPSDAVFDAAALGDLGVDTAVYDYLINPSFVIAGLEPGAVIEMTFFGSHKFNGDGVLDNDDISVYTVTTTEGVYSGELEIVGTQFFNTNEDKTVTISGIQVGADGRIEVDVSSLELGANGYLNAFSLTVVPTPGAALVAGVAGLVLVRRRR